MEHVIFCQKNATTLSYPAKLIPRDGIPSIAHIKTCAVIGAGVMGQGIAISFLQAGYNTILVDKDEQCLNNGITEMGKAVKKCMERQTLPANFGDVVKSKLKTSTQLELTKDADLVVEAIYEDAAQKKQMFKKLDAICKPDALLCTNTSTLDIASIANATKRASNVVGMHFFNPAHMNKLIEIIYTDVTNEKALNIVAEVAKRLDKVPVIVKNAAGFCGNRMCCSYFVEALKLIAQGYLPQEIDEAMKQFGFAMGPFQMQDLIGLDTINRISTENKWDLHPMLSELCKLERFGRKSGKGWYLYRNGKREIDSSLQEILKKFIANQPKRLNKQDLIKTLLYPLVNEGFKIVEEQVVTAPEAIDLIWLMGYGWPLDKGGPMYWAQQQGLKNLLFFLATKSSRSVETYWKPSQLLQNIVAKGNVPLRNWGNENSSKL